MSSATVTRGSIMKTSEYALGTSITRSGPWSVIVSARVMCADGKVRTARNVKTADTWFSVPCTVTVKGKTVAGFLAVNTVDGYDTATDSDPAVAYFRAYTYRKNGHLLTSESK